MAGYEQKADEATPGKDVEFAQPTLAVKGVPTFTESWLSAASSMASRPTSATTLVGSHR